MVTLDSQGGSTLAPIWTTAGSTVLLPENPSKPGYAFKGWYTEPNGEGSLFYIDTPVTESLTVYAYWEEIPTGIIDEQPSDNFYEILSAHSAIPTGMASATSTAWQARWTICRIWVSREFG